MAVDANGNEIIQPQVQPVELSRAEERIKQLSDKVELTSKERDEMKTLAAEKDTKISELERENTFNSGYADVLGTHSAAKDHKDEIKAKVLTGMSVEDATYAVLGKAGKLGGTAPQQTASPAGGSAVVNIPSNADKPVSEMSLAEKRAQLEKDIVWL